MTRLEVLRVSPSYPTLDRLRAAGGIVNQKQNLGLLLSQQNRCALAFIEPFQGRIL
ncbi:MAG: hypothetical protein LAQ69_03795 [Acidobacteriia bacterium]|nr:hypothetical protein [Terriglobia bacterium]